MSFGPFLLLALMEGLVTAAVLALLAFAAAPDASRHVLAHVFKIIVDPYMGKVGVFRVHQGTIR